MKIEPASSDDVCLNQLAWLLFSAPVAAMGASSSLSMKPAARHWRRTCATSALFLQLYAISIAQSKINAG